MRPPFWTNAKATQARDRTKDAASALEELGEVRKPLEFSVAGSEFKTLDNLVKAKLAVEAAKEIEDVENDLKDG